MNKQLSCEVDLIVHSAVRSCDDLIALIESKPDKVIEKGEYISKSGNKRVNEHSSIYFNSKKGKHSSVEEHIEELLTLLRSFQNSLPKDCDYEIWCTLSSMNDISFVGISLDKVLIARAASLSVAIIFSIWGQEGRGYH